MIKQKDIYMQLVKNNGIKYYILPYNLYVCKYKDNEYVIHCMNQKDIKNKCENKVINTLWKFYQLRMKLI